MRPLVPPPVWPTIYHCKMSLVPVRPSTLNAAEPCAGREDHPPAQPGGGRIAAHEIMICTAAIRNLIRESKIAQMYSAIQTGGKLGMQTLDQCLKGLVEKNLISAEAAREKAKLPDDFR